MPRSIPRSLVALGFMGMALTACAPTVATRGNLVEQDRMTEVQAGVSTKDDVATLLGTPSSTGTFDQDTWYYIGQRTEKTAFFRPEVIERRVVVVHFDGSGVVQEVKELDLDDAQEVEIVNRTTPTAGRDLTLLEQMLGNIGRFPGSKAGGGMPGPTKRRY